jgi:hypothetical protein
MIERLKPFVPAWLHPRNTLGPEVIRRTGGRVATGPFEGMELPALDYVLTSLHSAYYPKLLGIYELELHDSVDEMIALNPSRIVNIGAGEGYYAVGLAKRLPTASVVAFEADERAHPALAKVADRNGVRRRVDVRGACDPKLLTAALAGAGRTAVVCDVEGYEDVLLDPAAVPGLEKCWILVELHEAAANGVTSRLKDRFSATHTIAEIPERKRTRADYPYSTLFTKLLPEYYVTFVVREHRKERMTWLWMTPKAT